jgi:hypothetical protein
MVRGPKTRGHVTDSRRLGSLPNGVIGNPEFNANPNIVANGFKGHGDRTHEMDRAITQIAKERGWSDEKLAHFVVSAPGRHIADTMSGTQDEGTRDKSMKQILDRFDKKYKSEDYRPLK